jgi:hypothetical protein
LSTKNHGKNLHLFLKLTKWGVWNNLARK